MTVVVAFVAFAGMTVIVAFAEMMVAVAFAGVTVVQAKSSLIFAAQMKSFSLRPSMAWVVNFTSQ